MIRRLFLSRAFEEAVDTILDDVIALLGAEYGNVQLSMGDELVIAAQRGLSEDFLKTFIRVKKDDGSACGRALRLGKSVIIPDVENDPEFAAFLPDAKKAGFARSRVRHSLPKTEMCWGWCPRILHMLMSPQQLRCRR
jgi:GAF domain-containing protein